MGPPASELRPSLILFISPMDIEFRFSVNGLRYYKILGLYIYICMRAGVYIEMNRSTRKNLGRQSAGFIFVIFFSYKPMRGRRNEFCYFVTCNRVDVSPRSPNVFHVV